MKGIMFDMDILEPGLPVKFSIGNGDMFGLIKDVGTKQIAIYAIDHGRNGEFWTETYDIEQLESFETLGEWENRKAKSLKEEFNNE